MKGRTLSLTLGLLLGLSGCVIHVHEKGETEGSASTSSGGETASQDKPSKPVAQKPAKPVADKDDKPAKPVVIVEKPAKPADKPAKPVVPEKPVADKPAKPVVPEKPIVIGDKPVKPVVPAQPGAGDDKPAKPGGTIVNPIGVEKPVKPVVVADKPLPGTQKPVQEPEKPTANTGGKPTENVKPWVPGQGKEPERPDKVVDVNDRADNIDPKESKGKAELMDPSKVVRPVYAPNKPVAETKPAVTGTVDPVKGTAASGATAAQIEASRSCKLFNASVESGSKLRLRMQGFDESAQVLLEDEPLKVLRRDARAWVVQLEDDAKSGRVSVKAGDVSTACGKIAVK